VELLTTSNPERAQQLAEYLEQLNGQRQTVERKIFKQAKEAIEEKPDYLELSGLVLEHPEWHPGVIGIVANRIAEQFERPAIMLAKGHAGHWHGSGRSFNNLNLFKAVEQCQNSLLSFGGHHAAVGLRINTENIPSFRQAFSEAIAGLQRQDESELEMQVDSEIDLNELTLHTVQELEMLGPFGKENERPVFAATTAELAEPPRKMGEGDRHLCIQLKQDRRQIKAIAFGRGEWADKMQEAKGKLHFCFAPMINRYRGYENVELQLIDWRVAE
jgi:single-stranded-DNA-specific exonuclease